MTQSVNSNVLVLSPALMAAVEAVAVEAHQPVGAIVREALERYLAQRRGAPGLGVRRTSVEAASRMRQRRGGNRLPDGVTIRDLMTHGRV